MTSRMRRRRVARAGESTGQSYAMPALEAVRDGPSVTAACVKGRRPTGASGSERRCGDIGEIR